jgi:hypothetical protein
VIAALPLVLLCASFFAPTSSQSCLLHALGFLHLENAGGSRLINGAVEIVQRVLDVSCVHTYSNGTGQKLLSRAVLTLNALGKTLGP